MPRRHRSARDRQPPPPPRPPRGVPPAGTQRAGYTVWSVSQESKEYRCPGCQQEVRAGTQHLVVFPDDEPDLRRHWHTPCWQQDIRRGR